MLLLLLWALLRARTMTSLESVQGQAEWTELAAVDADVEEWEEADVLVVLREALELAPEAALEFDGDSVGATVGSALVLACD